jgi:hypothetical protein
MENNIMRDLTLNEIEEVNGGNGLLQVAQWIAGSMAWEYRREIAQAYANHYRNMYASGDNFYTFS